MLSPCLIPSNVFAPPSFVFNLFMDISRKPAELNKAKIEPSGTSL